MEDRRSDGKGLQDSGADSPLRKGGWRGAGTSRPCAHAERVRVRILRVGPARTTSRFPRDALYRVNPVADRGRLPRAPSVPARRYQSVFYHVASRRAQINRRASGKEARNSFQIGVWSIFPRDKTDEHTTRRCGKMDLTPSSRAMSRVRVASNPQGDRSIFREMATPGAVGVQAFTNVWAKNRPVPVARPGPGAPGPSQACRRRTRPAAGLQATRTTGLRPGHRSRGSSASERWETCRLVP